MLVHLHVFFDCFHTAAAEYRSWIKDYLVHKAKQIYCLAPYRTKLQTPALDNMLSQHCIIYIYGTYLT